MKTSLGRCLTCGGMMAQTLEPIAHDMNPEWHCVCCGRTNLPPVDPKSVYQRRELNLNIAEKLPPKPRKPGRPSTLGYRRMLGVATRMTEPFTAEDLAKAMATEMSDITGRRCGQWLELARRAGYMVVVDRVDRPGRGGKGVNLWQAVTDGRRKKGA